MIRNIHVFNNIAWTHVSLSPYREWGKTNNKIQKLKKQNKVLFLPNPKARTQTTTLSKILPPLASFLFWFKNKKENLALPEEQPDHFVSPTLQKLIPPPLNELPLVLTGKEKKNQNLSSFLRFFSCFSSLPPFSFTFSPLSLS